MDTNDMQSKLRLEFLMNQRNNALNEIIDARVNIIMLSNKIGELYTMIACCNDENLINSLKKMDTNFENFLKGKIQST